MSTSDSVAGGGVRHIVLFTWVEGTSPQQIDAVRAGLTALPGIIRQIVDYRFGDDLGINQGNADFAVVADFASAEDYLAYRDHPQHRQLTAERVAPILERRLAIQMPLSVAY
jgi:hypothetical protein